MLMRMAKVKTFEAQRSVLDRNQQRVRRKKRKVKKFKLARKVDLCRLRYPGRGNGVARITHPRFL